MKDTKRPAARIDVTKDGPYAVSGGVPLSEQLIVTNDQGESLEYADGKKYPAQERYTLCRCGQSGHKPFCDDAHAKVKFDGTETAGRQPYSEQAETIEGPARSLTDAKDQETGSRRNYSLFGAMGPLGGHCASRIEVAAPLRGSQ
jgi:CDGSH-type Zn-finger protein